MNEEHYSRPAVSIAENGHISIRASALGNCLRALAAAGQGMTPLPPPPAIANAMRLGRELEEDVLAATGLEITARQLGVHLLVGENASVTGTLDAVGPRYLVEVKTCGRAGWRDWTEKGIMAHPRAAWQVSAYAAAVRLPVKVAVGLVEDGKLVDHVLLDLRDPPYGLTELTERVETIVGHIRAGRVPDLCEPDQGWCPWSYLHETLLVMDDELDSYAAAYLSLRDRITALEEERRLIAEKIRSVLEARGVSSIHTAICTVSSYERTNRYLDTEALGEAIDLGPYWRTRTSTVVQVRRRKEGSDDHPSTG